MNRLIACVLVLGLAGRADAAGPVRKILLKNGFRLVTAPDSSLPLVGICLGLGAGPAEEDDTNGGASQLLGLSLTELPEADPLHAEWAKTVELSGRDTAITAYKDTTLITFEVPTDRVELTLKVLAKRLHEPGAGLEKLGEIQARLLKVHANRAAQPLAHGRLPELFEALAYGKHPYARSPDGTAESVRALTRESAGAFQKAWWTPNNAVLTLVGDIDPEASLKQVNGLFGDMPAAPMVHAGSPDVPLPEAPRKEVLEVPVEGTQARVGWLGPPAGDPDVWPMRVLRAVLAQGRLSRLRRRLVDRGGRVVKLDSDFQFVTRNGYLSIDLTLTTPDLWPVVDDLVSEVERLRRAEVGSDELTRVRAFLGAENALKVENTGSFAERLARYELIDDVYNAESAGALIEQVTAAQIRQAAVKWLDPARMLVAAIRPRVGPAASLVRTESYVLPGGLALTVRSRPGSDSVGVSAAVRTVSNSADPKAHAVAMLGGRSIGGTSRRSSDEMAVHLESLGTHMITQVQDGIVTLLFNATTDTLDDVLTALREMLAEARVPAAELARSRAALVAETKERLSQDDYRANVEMLRDIYPDRAGVQLLVAPDEMLKLSGEDVNAWLAETLIPARTVIAVSSALPPERVRDLVAARFAGWNAPGQPAPAFKPLEKFQGRVSRTVSEPGRVSDMMFVAFRMPPESNREFAAVSVCMRALGAGKKSILWKRLAKLDPTYQPLMIGYALRAEGSTVTYGFRLEKGTGAKALKEVDASIAELTDPGPPAGDLADTRDFVLNFFLKEQQNRVSEAGSLCVATSLVNDPRFFADAAEKYRMVTPSDVKKAAGWFQSYRAVIFDSGPK